MWQHSVEICKFFPHDFFCRNSVKSTTYLIISLVNSSLSRFFCQVLCVHDVWKIHSVLWKLRKFTVILFWQIFRESNVFTKENTKELIWRKKILGESALWNEEFTATQFFPSNQLWEKFRQFHEVFATKPWRHAVTFYNLHTTCVGGNLTLQFFCVLHLLTRPANFQKIL